ncbi:MAG: sigma-54-dependent Fis family transcriptional regulator [Deltaproteobacteria bacterium]|nr:sigma-54-dependent Fis family transcriptional regulator [Deltaproteobacteria bacterium]
MGRILIVDDDDQLRESFKKLLTQEGHETPVAANGETALEIVESCRPDLVILDVRLPGMNGLEVFKTIRTIDPKLPVIIMTAYATTNAAIEATKLGAFDYVLKPFDIPDMLNLIDQALEAGRFMRSRVKLDQGPTQAAEDAIIGRSKVMHELYKAIGRTAPTDATVLLRGESGTGKELVARAVYNYSARADRPFLVINCVAIPESLLESELFGYEKGAFTGAVSRRIGKIEQATGGTVFLDEIGDMPLAIQAKILRLLQERSLERLGGRETIQVDVRIIAATNRNLEVALKEGRFREDLYYRLNVVTLHIPPLRERSEDIGLLADYFLGRVSGRMGLANPGLTPEARTLLANQPWPGNVRELANSIEKAIIFSRGRPIGPEDLVQDLTSHTEEAEGPVDGEAAEKVIRQWIRQSLSRSSGDNRFASLTDDFASLVISEALVLTDGNRTRSAELLGVSRPTLLSKIEKYGLQTKTSIRRV